MSSSSSSFSIMASLASAISSSTMTSTRGIILSADSSPLTVNPASASARWQPMNAGTSVITTKPGSSSSRGLTSSAPASMAIANTSSSLSAGQSNTMMPLRSKLNNTEPGSAIFPPLLLTIVRVSAFARFTLSVFTSMTMPTPPRPYASYVISMKSPCLPSLALLRLRSMRSRGTLSCRARSSTRASFVFPAPVSPPPSFTACTISLPYLPYSLVRFASFLFFVCATLAAFRPMHTGVTLIWRLCCSCTGRSRAAAVREEDKRESA
mmetsp:Transcript_14720/g.35574  ORF Transcript_14720/g.35574 Transcript_14720/m.35574 type:complete len:266 (+) Transcript_14720:153-950(+)